MKPRAEGFTNEMMRWPPSWFHIVREIWGEFKNPWGLGIQAALFACVKGLPFNSWGAGDDLWSSRILFSSNLVGRIFFSLFSHKLSITFVLHAIFFFRQALAGIFFLITHLPPPSQELTGRPLSSFSLETNSDYNIYANAVNEIKAIVVPIWFADFI